MSNNVALAKNDENKMLLVIGKGIAFGKKANEIIDESSLEVSYIVQNIDKNKVEQTTRTISPEILHMANIVLQEAKKAIDKEFYAHTLLIIADHINFAVERIKTGTVIKSPLEYEIRRLYHKEVEIANKSLKIFKESLGIVLPKEEETMIALHLVNAQTGNQMLKDSMEMIELTNSIINIVNYHFQIVLNEERISFNRFMIHLKYLIMKYINMSDNEHQMEEHNALFEYFVLTEKDIYSCVIKIKNFLISNKNWVLTNSDELYLMVHIKKLVSEEG